MQAEALLAPAAAAGWVGQACFFSRFLVQWLASERARRCIVPRGFWWLSLAGSALMSVYALSRGTELFLLGFVVSGVIAARNLVLSARGARLEPRWAALLAALALAGSLWLELASGSVRSGEAAAWLALGVLGQALWMARFPVQWWLSERRGTSHFPPSFWWLSLAGNGLLLACALHLGDLLLVLGFLPGPLLQARNLVLGRAAEASARGSGRTSPPVTPARLRDPAAPRASPRGSARCRIGTGCAGPRGGAGSAGSSTGTAAACGGSGARAPG